MSRVFVQAIITAIKAAGCKGYKPSNSKGPP